MRLQVLFNNYLFTLRDYLVLILGFYCQIGIVDRDGGVIAYVDDDWGLNEGSRNVNSMLSTTFICLVYLSILIYYYIYFAFLDCYLHLLVICLNCYAAYGIFLLIILQDFELFCCTITFLIKLVKTNGLFLLPLKKWNLCY